MQDINIGDKVRFLNSIGGGTVTGFKKGGIVLVEDEDGFDIPVQQNEVVLISQSEKKITGSSYTTPKREDNRPLPQPKSPQETKAPQATAAASLHTSSQANNSGQEDSPSLEERIVHLEATVKRLTLRIQQLEDAKALREKVKGDNNIRITEAKHPSSLSPKSPSLIEIDLHATEILDTTAGMSAKDIKDYQLKVFRDAMNAHLKEKGKKIVFIHGNGDGVLRQAILSELKHSYKQCQWQDASFQQYGFGATMVTIR